MLGNLERAGIIQFLQNLQIRVAWGTRYFFFFFINNKNSLIIKRRHPSTQGVYMGEQVKNENYKSQVNPK